MGLGSAEEASCIGTKHSYMVEETLRLKEAGDRQFIQGACVGQPTPAPRHTLEGAALARWVAGSQAGEKAALTSPLLLPAPRPAPPPPLLGTTVLRWRTARRSI